MIYEIKEYREKTIKKYKINGNKIIVYYINGYYDVLDYSKENIDGLNLVMDIQLESFLKEQEILEKQYNMIDDKINNVSSAIKLAFLGDLREISKTISTSKQLQEKLEYMNLCRTYYEHKEYLNLDTGNFEVINANNFEDQTAKALLSISYQKKKKKLGN